LSGEPDVVERDNPTCSGTQSSRACVTTAIGRCSFDRRRPTTHIDNRSLALAVVRRLADGATTLADALPVGHPALARYRLIGDPLAPLIGARGARRGIASVFAPATDGQLPPVEWLVPAESRT
jgi:hypothetical protein